MSLNTIITNALADAATQMANQVLHEAINRLASKYGFDFAEAIQFINVAPARPEVLKKKDLPWCGVVNAEWCCGITSRGGLYTQCSKSPIEGGVLCGTCTKQKNETGSLKFGTVSDRLAAGPFDFTGGKIVPFSKTMEKNGWSRELVDRSAAEYGLTIPEENYIAPKPKRGRKVTRPVMEAPEPEGPVIRMEPDSYDPTESLTAAMSSLTVEDEEEVISPLAVEEVKAEIKMSAVSATAFVTYNATDPSSSDEEDGELEEEAPVVVATPVEVKKVKKPRAPKAEGEKKEKKPRAPKGEKKEEKLSVAEEVASDESCDESPVASPVASPVEPKKVNGSPPSDSEASNSSSVSEFSLGAAAENQVPKKEKKVVDYSNISPVDAATIKPMALRTACLQHGIELGTKSVETLRAELIEKVTP